MQCTYAHTHTSVLQMWTIAYRQQLPALPIQAEQHAQGVWRLEGGTGQHTRTRAHVRVRLDARNHNNPTRARAHTHTNTCTETRVWNGDRQAQRELSGDRGDPTRKRENFNVAGNIRWEHSAIEGEHNTFPHILARTVQQVSECGCNWLHYIYRTSTCRSTRKHNTSHPSTYIHTHTHTHTHINDKRNGAPGSHLPSFHTMYLASSMSSTSTPVA